MGSHQAGLCMSGPWGQRGWLDPFSRVCLALERESEGAQPGVTELCAPGPVLSGKSGAAPPDRNRLGATEVISRFLGDALQHRVSTKLLTRRFQSSIRTKSAKLSAYFAQREHLLSD